MFEDTFILKEDVMIEKKVMDGFASATNRETTVTLDVKLTEALVREGWMRELIRAIQSYRKQLLLPVEQRVDIILRTDNEMHRIIKDFHQMLEQNVLMRELIVTQASVQGLKLSIGDHEIEIELSPLV